ncbi:MAG: hypothetical protein BWY76_00058 [bacterium ADurb.Bin429]|nr:MAG: hypothetical protein BWY76_00058 [bacterium ADurb.Bin429]
MIIRTMLLLSLLLAMLAAYAEILTFDAPQTAGMSGFRAHWNMPIPVAEDGKRVVTDAVVKDRGQTAVWDGATPGPLAFDAVHRSLLVRFPGAAEGIAAALAKGQVIEKVELVLPYLDEELWPQGRVDYPGPDGYRYRTNWDCDKLYRAQRPNWHAVAHALRKPWQANAQFGPTYNAAVNGAIYWKRYGATDTTEDRFPAQFGPAEVSSYQPDGRMDVTALLTDAAYGQTPAARLRVLADCGFIVSKWEVYDARYFQGAYEWAISTGPRAILIKQPKLVVTLKAGKAETVALAPAADVSALAAKHAEQPVGVSTAVVPTPSDVTAMNARFLAKPAWMPEWQYARVRQLMGLESGGVVQPFYYRVLPQHVINRAIHEATQAATKAAGKRVELPADEKDHAVYLAWLDWVHGRPPRSWEGHLTAADNVTQWYNYRDAMPGPVQDSVIRCWTAWLMPGRETAMTDKQRKDFGDLTGKIIHPMADDPRVGVDATGKQAEWGQGDTYYKKTGDWRGNKSYYRSGFTRMMSTANFNSSASSGALLNGQIIGSEHAMADGRAGLMTYPFWLWTYNSGAGQEYIDHYYWAIATAGNKLFPDFCEQPEDKMAGQSILFKTVNDLANGYHPNLRKLIGPASRTYFEHVLGQQDGLYHILHVLSPRGALCDVETGALPDLTMQAPDGKSRRPISAWGHDYPAATVALQSLSGPWSEPWLGEMIDEKPLPWFSMAEKKVVADGDWVSTHFGMNYGLSSIRLSPQRIHVLGHWRRKAELPASMRDIGTLDLRIGFNSTTVGNDLEGTISAQGKYRCYQRGGTLIMLARPQADVIAKQAGERQFGQRKLPAQEITSVQCSAALFNYEQPATWRIFVDDTPVTALPAVAKSGQVITIQDGVSYLALRPLPTGDFGRDVEVRLEAGLPQTQAYHESTNIQPALLINAYLYQRDTAIPADTLKRLDGSQTGFVVEMGDVNEYGSFDKFRAAMRGAKVAVRHDGAITYQRGKDTLAASWDAFTVNGADPYAVMRDNALWQDTPLSQMGRKRLEKLGAVVERGARHPELPMFLHALPKQRLYVATNPLPNYLDYRFREPGGVTVVADGALSMGRWAVKDSREIDITYHAFGDKYLPKPDVPVASVLFITGAKAKPRVTLNGKDVTNALKAWKQDAASGWLVSLTGTFPTDEEIAARLAAAR